MESEGWDEGFEEFGVGGFLEGTEGCATEISVGRLQVARNGVANEDHLLLEHPILIMLRENLG